MNRTERLHALTESVRRSAPRGRTAEQLAREFEVTTRTVKRDLAAGGLPVWDRTGPGGGYGLNENASVPPTTLTAAQAVVLTTAVTSAAHAPFADSARAATRSVLDVPDPPTRRRVAELSGRVWVDVSRSTRREVEPMIFALTGGRWRLVGWCRLRDGVRWFDLSRVRAASATRCPCSGHDIPQIGRPPESARTVGV